MVSDDGRILVLGAIVATVLAPSFVTSARSRFGSRDTAWNVALRNNREARESLTGTFVDLVALYRLLQTFHWQTRGETSYGDHLLFQRLYEDVQKEIDGTGERLVGLFDAQAVDSASVESAVTKRLQGWTGLRSSKSLASQALTAEHDVVASLHRAIGAFASDPGTQNLLQGFADKHVEHLYLLQQRTS